MNPWTVLMTKIRRVTIQVPPPHEQDPDLEDTKARAATAQTKTERVLAQHKRLVSSGSLSAASARYKERLEGTHGH